MPTPAGVTIRVVVAAVHSGQTRFAGRRISYRVAGDGPALVVVKPHRRPRDCVQLRLLAGRYRVIQVEPLGFGESDPLPADSAAHVHEQVLAVVDHEAVDRFAVWGYSQGGAMAATVAQATPRVVALVAGGFSLVDRPTRAQLARMDREQRVPPAPRAFWHWYRQFDWFEELAAMPFPRLLYVGSDDRTYGPGIRRFRGPLAERGVAVVEFAGLDHLTCTGEPAMSTRVVPAVGGWLDGNVTTRR